MSLKLEYVSKNKQLKATFEGKGEKEVFEQIAHFQEIFESNQVCGECNGDRIHFSVREVDGNNYYEKVCQDCKSKFSYGQHKQGGTLFPNNSKGWHKWVPGSDNNAEEKDDAYKPRTVKGKK